jgi:hypothetical protein
MANAEHIRPLLSLPSEHPSAATLAVQRQQLVVVNLNTADRCAPGAALQQRQGSGHTVPRRHARPAGAVIYPPRFRLP